MSARSDVLAYETTNAALGWAVIGVLVLIAVTHVRAGELLWAGMTAAVIAVGVVPPFRSRTARRMIAWEVLVLATLPAAARAFGYFVGPTAYLSVAALALVVAVELDEFTTVRMTPAFAVGFVVLLTMAAAGLWTIARYFSDLYFGTTLIGGQTAANWDLVAATGIGLAAGGVFELYFRRLSPHTRLDFERWGEEP